MDWGWKGFFKRLFEFPDADGDDGVSPAGRARLRYDLGADQLQVSRNQGAYLPIATGGAGVSSVDTITELSALNDAAMLNGATVEVNSVLDQFVLDATSTAVVDGITIAATLSGTGRWIRRELPSITWTTQATWYLDPTNGNDENVGDTAGTAIKTWDELRRRFGRLPLKIFITVNLLGNLLDIVCDFECELVNNFQTGGITIAGVHSQDLAQVITTATAHNNATRTMGQLNMGVDVTAQASKLMVVENGAAAGATAFYGKQGATVDDVITGPFLSPGFAETFPANGDTIGFYSLTSIRSITVLDGCILTITNCQITDNLDVFSGSISVGYCRVDAASLFASSIQSFSSICYSSRFGNVASFAGTTQTAIYTCMLASRFVSSADPGNVLVGAGYTLTAVGTGVSPILDLSNGMVLLIDGAVAFYDTVATTTCLSVARNGMVTVTGDLWGRNIVGGGAGVVVQAKSNSVVAYANGNPPDFAPNTNLTIGGTAKTLATIPYPEPTNFAGVVINQ